MSILCQVYRSSRKEGMYLFMPKDADVEQLPQVLMQQFGTPEPALSLLLTADKKLARADAAEVLQKIDEQGFYLQMPPSVQELAQTETPTP